MKQLVNNFKDSLALQLFDRTESEAQSQKICIRCASPVDTYDWSPADIDEYLISSLCPACSDELCPPWVD